MRKILILDDFKDYLRALRSALGNEFKVVETASMDEAKRALDQSVQVALVDVRLSEVEQSNQDGMMFLQWTKEHYPEMPILMMSAYQNFEAVEDALDLGADYFLKNPIDLRELKSVLHECAEHGRLPEKTAALRRRMESER